MDTTVASANGQNDITAPYAVASPAVRDNVKVHRASIVYAIIRISIPILLLGLCLLWLR